MATSFSITYFPFLGANNSVTVPNFKYGTAINVAADGSAVTNVTFSPAFVTSVNLVLLQPTGATFDNYELTWQPTAVTTTGFSISVTGGPAGSTVNVYWQATGA